MKFIIKQKLFFFFLISLTGFLNLGTAYSQDVDETLLYARNLMAINEPQQAVEAYRRVLFFQPEKTALIALETGNAFCTAGDYNDARYYYKIAFHNETESTKKADIEFKIIHSYILEKEYMKAKLNLAVLRNSKLTYSKRKMAFYDGIINFETDNMEKAMENFNEYFSGYDTSYINSLFTAANQNERMNPKKAMWMSIFVPGLGQAYAGEYEEAANSFLINTVILSLYFYVALTYNPLQGLIAVIPWFQRYYIGGINKSQKITKEKKKAVKEQILVKLLQYATTIE